LSDGSLSYNSEQAKTLAHKVTGDSQLSTELPERDNEALADLTVTVA